jgi:serine/threonine protein kinase
VSSGSQGGRAPAVAGFDRLREIGRGGSSTVYAARQVQLDRTVALKVLHVPLGDDAARRRFERECAVLGALGDAPGVVPVFDAAFTDDGRGCIVMRLMRESLAEMLERVGPLDPALVREVGISASTALGHAHRRGVVHRDVKPANLLVSEFGEIALADFDIASMATLASSTLTSDSMSPPHAAPERLSGSVDGGVTGDIWSLGSTLFTLLAGRPPFGTASTAGGMAGLVDRVLRDDVPPLGRDDVSPAFDEILRRALAKDPSQRWADAAAMRAALETLEPIEAPSRELTPMPRTADQQDTIRPAPPRSTVPERGQAEPSRVSNALTATLVLVVVVVAIVATLLIAFG